MVPFAAIPWLRGLWRFYREYTNTSVHTAAAAALAIFGLLVFVDPLFAVLAIGSYVVPPVVLYALEDASEGQRPLEREEERTKDVTRAAVVRDGDTDSDRDDGDTDSDRNDGDSDSDRDASG